MGEVEISRDGLLEDPVIPAVWTSGLLREDAGQATTEYAMILVVVAVIAVALFAVGPTALRKVFGSVVDFIVSTIPGG